MYKLCTSKKKKTFDGLVGFKDSLLSYDFYLPDYNKLIEYQGKQHEYAVDWFGGEKQLEKQKAYDALKREYAKINGYDLIEIWYYDFNNIDSILDGCLNEKKDTKKNNIVRKCRFGKEKR